MHFNVNDLFYSIYSHQHVSVTVAAIFRMMMLLKISKCANVVSWVAVTP